MINLPYMIAGVMGNDPAIQTEATTAFRRLLSTEKNPPIQQVIESGVVPRFVQFLMRGDNPALQFEAAWALKNIASGTCEHTKVVIEVGAVPIFVQLLLSAPNDDVREQAVVAVGEIVAKSPPCRDLVLQLGAIVPLLAQLNANCKLSMQRSATWTLSKLCHGKPQPTFIVVRESLPILKHLLIHQSDEEVLTYACWALSYLSDGGSHDVIEAVIEAGISRRIVDLLCHPSPAVQTPALRTVGNIVTGDDRQTQYIINQNALPYLSALLVSPKKGIRKEACRTISNITAGNKEQIQSVINSNIVTPLIQLLSNAECDIRKETASAISNATSGGTPEQIKYMVSQGCIRPLCDLLTVNDAKIITIALEGLENILKVGDDESKCTNGHNHMATLIAEAEGLTKIEELQNHSSNDIYEKCIKILESYFGVEEEDEIQGIAIVEEAYRNPVDDPEQQDDNPAQPDGERGLNGWIPPANMEEAEIQGIAIREEEEADRNPVDAVVAQMENVVIDEQADAVDPPGAPDNREHLHPKVQGWLKTFPDIFKYREGRVHVRVEDQWNPMGLLRVQWKTVQKNVNNDRKWFASQEHHHDGEEEYLVYEYRP